MADRPLSILMMIHRLTDNSPYCFYVHEQAKALASLGHDVRVISCLGLPPPGIRLTRERADTIASTPLTATVDGIPVAYPRYTTLGNAGERLLGGHLMARAALPVARKMHAQKPFDIVHAHMIAADGHAGLLVAKKLGIPCALTVHGTDVLRYFVPGQKPLARMARTADGVDALMAVSSLLMKRVAPYRAQDKLTRIVPNGVDLSLVPEETQNRPRAVISVGTLKARKCMDRTLEAFARVARDYPEATLTIVGQGEMEARLRARIGELGLRDRVTLTGGLPHEEVLRRMAESDLFVLPSWGEGYGIVYIEAMAAGCVAVGAKDEGIADTITDGGNGLLVPAGDIDATERAMRSVFERPADFAALRERGRQSARELTWARNARTVEGIYREAIARRGRDQGRNDHAKG